MYRTGVVKVLLGVVAVFGLVAGWSGVALGQGIAGAADVQTALDAGRQQLEDGNYDAAINTYSQIIQAYTFGATPPAEAHLNRAKAYEAVREYAAAMRDYSAAIESEAPQFMAEAYNGRGEIRLQFGGTDSIAVQQALSDFSKAVEYDRANPTYSVNLAKALVRLRAASEALTTVNRALKADENNAEAYRTRAQAYALLQDFEQATADIARAAQLEPDNHENHYVMGMIHMENKQHQQAVDAFHRAKETYQPENPDDPAPYVEPYLAASLAYIELGKESRDPSVKRAAYVKAIEETQKTLEEQPRMPLAYLNRGVALRLLELYKESLEAFTQAIELAPEFAEAYFRRGIVWYYMGHLDLARKDFREAIAINYDDVRPYLWMGMTYADEGDYHEAIVRYAEAINLNPKYVPAYINRGLAYAQLGDFEKAVDSFNDAIRLEPGEPTHYFKRGSVLMALGRYDDALQSFSDAIGYAPYYADAFRKAGEALQQLGRRELAARYVQRANEIEAAVRDQLQTLRRQSEEQTQQMGQSNGLPDADDVLATAEDEAANADPGLDLGAPADGGPAIPLDPDPNVANPFAIE